ncbi:DUF3043 domain-containing protein [Luteipulveratus sp. YIM 133132]|uniref:DUF3043 domain-containing protein n=1 Tax=Luteipulveratus flavus TaxID=3031728 RepID=A0ABT6C5T7_9MICO|nr:MULTISPECIES: DUF3043 domain-containing protein [unclassified Luteipulveratus]MDE9366422.1 DUF3043 domain-containing protein [Luteipulveratus sp. YIM 133132]MDF8264303.1 DUF3043 domain-containing protein [Luteipulveratus sp. YIM 133296]
MFRRQKDKNEAPVDPEPDVTERPGAKNKPTPKRRDQEAARRKPLVPTDRKAAKQASRDSARAQRMQRRDAMNRGEESALPARDRGPVKRFIRNTVDARWNIGEILLPLMLIVLVLMFAGSAVPAIQMVAILAVWAIVLVGIADAYLLWRRTKKAIVAKFGEEPPRGSASYTIMRSFQMRMSRMPKPQVARGDKSWK